MHASANGVGCRNCFKLAADDDWARWPWRSFKESAVAMKKPRIGAKRAS